MKLDRKSTKVSSWLVYFFVLLHLNLDSLISDVSLRIGTLWCYYDVGEFLLETSWVKFKCIHVAYTTSILIVSLTLPFMCFIFYMFELHTYNCC